MKEKKEGHPKSTSSVLTRTFHEILIADKRSYEPFVKLFRAEGENVSKLDLGTLIGVFEIDEKDEDAAYIVNFLASVAKKEYFNNPRRGPIESFEAALHKVNVALAELVKHGNVSWLGKLHGALAVLEKNNLHFSVTGEAAILLYRQEQFSEISEGLASDEAESHPLKTFVEVSSGRMTEADTLLLTTPELQALFPLEYLTKQAMRMNAQSFRQFLRTALVNEIDMAAVLAIEFSVAPIEEKIASTKKKSEASTKNTPVVNAFSQSSYKTEKPVVSTLETIDTSDSYEIVKEEFIDEKTGHIYVQGEESSTLKHSPVMEALHETSSQLGEFFSRTFRRQGKKTARFGAFLLWEGRKQADRLKRKAGQKISTLKSDLQVKQSERAAQKTRKQERSLRIEARQSELLNQKTEAAIELPLISEEIPLDVSSLEPEVSYPEDSFEEPLLEEVVSPEIVTEKAESPSHIERFRLLYERARQTTPPQKTKQKKVSKNAKKTSAPAIFPNYYSRVSIFLPSVYGKCRQLIQIILPYLLKQKKPLLITFVLVLVISGITFWFFQKKDVVVSVQETIKNETPTLSNKEVPVSNILKSESTFTLNKELAGITFLSNQAYGATLKGIIDLESKEEFVIPDIKGEVRFLTPMEDLGLIFILSSQNELFAWSPLNKSFTKNDLTLPENARVTGVGTYLTYLYVLDRGNNQLYRYPRAENGFRDATPWMKESFELTDTAFLAINETIALSPSREHLLSFSQGKNTGTFTLKDPQSPMAIKALTTNSDSPFLYALDANSNLSVWNLDRTLLHTYTLNDTPKDYQFLTVDPEKNTLLVGNKEGNITRYINVESE